MIDDNLKPWLLEINKCPTMSTKTSIQEDLVANLIQDQFKIILDRRKDSNADIGSFFKYEMSPFLNKMDLNIAHESAF